MRRALKWSASLFAGYLFITYQVLTDGFMVRIDRELSELEHPRFTGTVGFIVRRLDDLGLRGVSGIALLIVALYISRRFKTWRPINLGLLSFISLNVVVGAFKYGLGRTKPRDGFDILHAGGMSYPSGHASNAIFIWGVVAYLIYRYAHVDRYNGRLASAGVGLLALTVCVVSLLRNTHWFLDLFGGLLLGGALLVLIIAIDRFFPSDSQLH
ncbi:membrane-associated phospholipid phosphatase [Candidatus Planktophila dulcis]|uniref:Membrane-associated phospholipid phosphatase n=2 Tax=Candidatus Planktophila dulcis TaxID=1884914 RepID=A0AAC9YWA7_9ACTN|nr:membrane-associated phospholipid phosphatase [Candidatus Planktophila dulcis]ASY15314.1 membrane-associated phospholipid phosphatase [Candidatus Planktophila dulcis]ASY21997.1 membrane-associated phospholipid phosphatase [Candidatus Planktophila dulcis]